MQINPQPITGPWRRGYTLDQHTIHAEFLGYDLNERPIFDTTRSEIGELLFQCKYRGDREASTRLAEVAAEFIRDEHIQVDVVVPVPPSKLRSFQPLISIASQLAVQIGVSCDLKTLTKIKETPELKGIEDMADRATALTDAFGAQRNALRGMEVLLFDDLYRSGASMSAAARVLRDQAGASNVFALALTRTRSRR